MISESTGGEYQTAIQNVCEFNIIHMHANFYYSVKIELLFVFFFSLSKVAVYC